MELLAAFDSKYTYIGISFILPFYASQSNSFPILEMSLGIQSLRLICPVFFCWKSASSSSPEFLAGNPFTASFPSVLKKSNLPSRKFGSLSSLTKRPSSLKTKCGLYGITCKIPSQAKRLTFLCWKSVCHSARSSLSEIRPPFRLILITGNPSALPSVLYCRKSVVLPPILHYWKSVFPSAHSSLPEICLPFRSFFIAGILSVLPLILYCRKSVCSSAQSSLLEICPLFCPIFITGNPSALLSDPHYWKSVCSSVCSLLPEICLPFRLIFIVGNLSVFPSALHCCCYHNLLFRAISDSWF